MKLCTSFFLTILITGCSYYDKKDFEFSQAEAGLFSDYQVGDTIYFESNRGDTDTITIVGFGTERQDKSGFLAPSIHNSKWVEIKLLPVDRFSGMDDYQILFFISKYPKTKGVYYSVGFRDFTSASGFEIFHTDTIKLNDLKVSGYYELKHMYPERIFEPKDIKTVYWTADYGLTAYVSRDGETWTRKE